MRKAYPEVSRPESKVIPVNQAKHLAHLSIGTAYEVTARGMRVYPLEGPRTISTNVARAAGGADIVKLMKARL